ncbi:MAG TPA: hemerythrin domain-containing protein [Rhodanobacter sp.]|nr:hemerythrin domain-containing protein [Rhodanobacter sp.]
MTLDPSADSPVPPPTDEAPGWRGEPEQPRLLGRSRAYTLANLPERLRQWHAPRINRWERLWVTGSALAIEYLDASGTTGVELAAGGNRWFAPGTRWRVVRMAADSRFELEVHADVKGQAEAPQPLRSSLLAEAIAVTVADAPALTALLQALGAGERRLVAARFDLAAWSAVATRAHTLFWHPLAATAGCFTVLVARSDTPFDLPAYLGRDHAVIEATLGGALAGDAQYRGWLCATLERHLRIEEELIFPAYLAAGGREAWVKGLKHEHVFLRQYLGELDQPHSRRRFLRLLDGHDEKEERVIYPDVLAHVGAHANVLLDAAMAWPTSVTACMP